MINIRENSNNLAIMDILTKLHYLSHIFTRQIKVSTHRINSKFQFRTAKATFLTSKHQVLLIPFHMGVTLIKTMGMIRKEFRGQVKVSSMKETNAFLSVSFK